MNYLNYVNSQKTWTVEKSENDFAEIHELLRTSRSDFTLTRFFGVVMSYHTLQHLKSFVKITLTNHYTKRINRLEKEIGRILKTEKDAFSPTQTLGMVVPVQVSPYSIILILVITSKIIKKSEKPEWNQAFSESKLQTNGVFDYLV